MPISKKGRSGRGDAVDFENTRSGAPTDFSFDALLPVPASTKPRSRVDVDVPLELDPQGALSPSRATANVGVDTRKLDPTERSASATVVPGLARPRGAYPHFRSVGPFVFVSGIGARQPDNTIRGARADAMGTASLDIREQTRAVIENVRAVLKSAGLDLTDLVEITTFLVHMNDFGGYNEVYGEYFGADGPARTTVAVHQLPHPHMLIEMKAVAYRP